MARILALTGNDTEENRGRFGTSAARLAAADDLDALVAAWVATKTAGEVVETLLAAKIPVSRVNTVPDLLADPHVAARGSVVTVDDPELGALHLVPAAPKLDGTPAQITGAGPGLGQGAEAFLRDELGLATPDIDILSSSGVLDLAVEGDRT